MRKINNKLWLAAFALTLAACQNQDIEVSQPMENTAGTYTLHCIIGNGAQNRAQIELGNGDIEQEYFKWNKEDSFTLYDLDTESTETSEFSITGYEDDEKSLGASANFVGEGNWEEGQSVAAIYPAQANVANGKTVILSMPDGAMGSNSAEEQIAYMASRMFMYAKGTMNGVNTSLNFQHLTAMARITYTNATTTEQTISSWKLSGDGTYFGQSIQLSLNNGKASATFASETSLTFSELKVASGKTVDFYLLFFPGNNFNEKGTLTLTLTSSENVYSVTMDTDDIANSNGTTTFEAGKRYWFNVMQTQNEGLIWKKDMEEGTIYNLQLIQAIENQTGTKFTKDGNGFVNVAGNEDKIATITSLDVNNQELDNIEGVEYFTNLEVLRVKNMNLKVVDISHNTHLKTVDFSNNALTQLDVSKNTALEKLDCSENNITKLDVTNNAALKLLDCYNNSLEKLDISKNAQLEELYCGGNMIAELITENNPELITLNLTFGANGGSWDSTTPSNLIRSLDVSKNTKLKTLIVNNNQLITSLDVSQNTQLTTLDCASTQVTSLDVSKNLQLEDLSCRDADNLTSLDVSKNVNLQKLSCYYSPIRSLDLRNNTKLKELNCGHSKMVELDISMNLSLVDLFIANANLASIDISKYESLETLYCSDLPITSLDISKNTALKTLTCHDCRLSALDITHNPNLQEVYCGNQRDENYERIPLTLTMLQSQQDMWESVKDRWENENVTPNVVEK